MKEIIELTEHLQNDDNTSVIRESAKSIANIAIERYDAELLESALNVVRCIAQFANDLERVRKSL